MEHTIVGLSNVPLFFKIMLGLFIYSVILMIILWIQYDKYIKRILSYDDAKKERAIEAHKRLLRIHKIFFWFSPAYFITIYIIYNLNHGSDAIYGITMMIIVYLLAFAIYLFTKKILNRLNQ